MEAKLQELTQKLYQEGVEKARQEADTLINDAQKDADQLIARAKKEAESIVKQAKDEAQQIDHRIKSELKLTGEQMMSTLKQEITHILSKNALSSGIQSSVNDKDFIKSIIEQIVSKWDLSTKSLDLSIILPEKSQKELLDYFKKQAAEILKKGIELKFESRMDGGFKIAPQDNSFVLSFTDENFQQFFQSFLRPKTKEILFTGE